MTDSERLNWLEKNSFSIISNDMGWWCCTVDGVQSVPVELPCDTQTTFFIEKNQWFRSIRQAIDEAISDNEK